MKCARVLALAALVTAMPAEELLPESVMEPPTLPDAAGDGAAAAAAAAGGYRGVPIVKARQQYPRHKRSLQFDGWYPMDVSNPMADDPTVGYQPPPLERVHFSNEPVPKKPMYPVRPENPPVFVVRAEPRHPEYHSVYGTENIEYFHIHPQTNIVRAFRAPSQSVGAIRFVPAMQLEHSSQSSSSRPQTDALEVSSKNPGNNVHLNRNFNPQRIPSKDSGFADKSDIFDAYANHQLPNESPHLDTNDDYDMEGAFSEIRSTTVERPSHVFPFSRRDRNSGSGKQNAHSYRYRLDPPIRRLNQSRDQESKTTRPALHELLGNLPQESQIEEAPYLGSATDSAGASFIRKIPPPDFRYSPRGNTKQRQSGNNTRSRPRGSPQRQAPANSTQSFTRPWFLIDTRSDTSERKREPSIASYIHPETRSDGEKVHYKPLGPVSYVSKEGDSQASDHIPNPHLDDHMNSYKPTLTANSLSELLQIFRFTQVTDGPDGEEATDEPVTVVREFRYTRPTEEPPPSSSTEATTIQNILLTSYRYTSSTPSYNETTTEAEATEKPQGGDFDAVADTNSLDGYLFSDSEASPEYAHPQVRPNVVITEVKDKITAKGVTKATSRVSVQASTNTHVYEESPVTPETFKGLEIIYPGGPSGPPSKETTEASWPLYIIHQGHSKVRVFGINSAEDKSLGNPDYRELFVLSTLEPLPSSGVFLSSNATVDVPLATPSLTSTSLTTTAIPSATFSSTTTSSSTSTSTSATTIPITTDPASTSTVTIFTDPTSSPFPVEDTSTIPVTTEETTTTVPSTPITEQDLVLQNTTAGEYENYYTDEEEYDVPELAFGEDYQSKGDTRPTLLLQNPAQTSLSEQSFSPPPLLVEGEPDALPSATTFSRVLQDRLPRLKHRKQREEPHLVGTDAAVPLPPAAGLTRAELTVARPVFFTKRLAETTEERAQLSQPFEYLSQLRNLQSDQRTNPVSRSDDKPIPQPRMKRVTEAAPKA
nr:flocculation protein FLO11-like [Procambarus clarkii]